MYGVVHDSAARGVRVLRLVSYCRHIAAYLWPAREEWPAIWQASRNSKMPANSGRQSRQAHFWCDLLSQTRSAPAGHGDCCHLGGLISHWPVLLLTLSACLMQNQNMYSRLPTACLWEIVFGYNTRNCYLLSKIYSKTADSAGGLPKMY